jgi:acetolactate synthase-1/2/3 large subunit
VERHLARVFANASARVQSHPRPVPTLEPGAGEVARAASLLEASSKPLLLAGSGSMQSPALADTLAEAIGRLGVPTYLSGMSRGLLGRGHELHLRHARRKALAEADLVIASGTPFDFRLNYGRGIPGRTPVVGINRSSIDLKKNRRPDLGIRADPARTLIALSQRSRTRDDWKPWGTALRSRDDARETEIAEQALSATDGLNPIALCRAIETAADHDAVFVGDGGDFVATASYVLRPRAPLSWLDPGVFGTLGPGAGFALGAKLCRPNAEVWLLYGDGAAAFSLAEFDTLARHGVAVIGVVGNDAGWTQIARDQVDVFGDDLATVLARTDYDEAAKGLGAAGVRLSESGGTAAALAQAKSTAAAGRPVLVNAWIGRTDFRKGSLSV